MGMDYNPPTGADYAYASAQDAKAKAEQALATERRNAERLTALEARMDALEAHIWPEEGTL